VDEHYERMRARLLEAIAEHERGDLDNAGLRSTVERVLETLDNGPAEVRQALFEADIALEYAMYGHPPDDGDPAAPLKRMRRNLREALR
jgi:hypothetical protein